MNTEIKCYTEQELNIGIDNGIRAALDLMENEKKARIEEIRNWKYKSTRMLMENYRWLIGFKQQSATNIRKEVEDLFGITRLSPEEYLIFSRLKPDGIKTIDSSKAKTLEILTHVNSKLEILKNNVYLNRDSEAIRRFEVMYSRYVEIPEKNIFEIRKKFLLEKSQFYRDIDKAIRVFSVYLWGLDYIKLM